MGNQLSADGPTGTRPTCPFSRSGALSLSRSELDRRSQSSGLYDHCQWEDRAIRKLIGDGRIAARLKGAEDRSVDAERECPICFLQYSEINVTRCCHANICTECYLQVRPQKEKFSSCPFCNNGRLQVAVAKQLEEDQIKKREQDEQRVIEARLRARSMDTEDGNGRDASLFRKSSGFGSSAEKNSIVAGSKSRPDILAPIESGVSSDYVVIENSAMTPEERRRLEDEMRAQHSHPLALRIQAEAGERQLANERAYYRSNSACWRDSNTQSAAAQSSGTGLHGTSSGRSRPVERHWNQIVNEFERGENGEFQSMDDLVVLEAAILLSMEDETLRARSNGIGHSDFDASRHAREGFPLVRSFLARRSGYSDTGMRGATTTDEDNSSLPHAFTSSMYSRRRQLVRSGGYSTTLLQHPETSSLDAAALMSRELSEEEQVALAIEASLQENPQLVPLGEAGIDCVGSQGSRSVSADEELLEKSIWDESTRSEPQQPSGCSDSSCRPRVLTRPSWAVDIADSLLEESVDIEESCEARVAAIGEDGESGFDH